MTEVLRNFFTEVNQLIPTRFPSIANAGFLLMNHYVKKLNPFTTEKGEAVDF